MKLIVDNGQSNLQPLVGEINWFRKIVILAAESAQILTELGGI
jgi:hypothetical protein